MNRGKTRKRGFVSVYNVPAYVINMRERRDRWERFTEQPVVKEFKKLRKSVATNGQTLDPIYDKRISMHTKLNIFRNYRRSHPEIATLGAVGSSLSHIDVWKKFVSSGEQVCLVLEDDVILTKSQLDHVNELIPTLPHDWGMWILGFYRPNLISQLLTMKPWHKVYNFTAAHAYLLSREVAIKLLEEPFPVETHIEYYMTGSSILKKFNILYHPDIHIEFFQKKKVAKSATTTIDSNTSQHKKAGCPSCNTPEDYTQLYESPTRKNSKGIFVKGIIRGHQVNKILTLKRGATRKKTGGITLYKNL